MEGACLEAVAAQARECLPRFASMDVADTMWAFAKLRHNMDNSLLHDCEAHITRICDTFAPHQLVRCCPQSDRGMLCTVCVCHVLTGGCLRKCSCVWPP